MVTTPDEVYGNMPSFPVLAQKGRYSPVPACAPAKPPQSILNSCEYALKTAKNKNAADMMILQTDVFFIWQR